MTTKPTMNLWKVMNKLIQLENMLTESKQAYLQDFRAIDWRDYIQVPLENFEMIWKYKKRYFNSKLKLFRAFKINSGYDKTSKTFYSMITDPDRQDEMWDWEIQLIYASKRDSGRYFTCEGNMLTANSLTHIRANPNNNKMNVTDNGETFVTSRSLNAYAIFIDPEIEDATNFMFHDGFYGNCGIDNLSVADADLATKGQWKNDK